MEARGEAEQGIWHSCELWKGINSARRKRRAKRICPRADFGPTLASTSLKFRFTNTSSILTEVRTGNVQQENISHKVAEKWY